MSAHRHEALNEALAAYAIDAVANRNERTVIEAHLESCQECLQELSRHRAAAAALAPADSPLPDGLWERIQTEIRHPRSRPSATAPIVPLSRRWIPLLSAAAAITLALMVGVQTLRLDQTRDELALTRQQLSAIQGAVASGDYQAIAEVASTAPGAMTVALDGDAGSATATILPDGSGFLDVHELTPLNSTSTYQLWAVLDGEVISAAVLGVGDRSVAPFQVDPAVLEALVVTEETAGGVAVSSQPAATAWSSSS
jgi:hypothetical protein